jgi:hypothetical protein
MAEISSEQGLAIVQGLLEAARSLLPHHGLILIAADTKHAAGIGITVISDIPRDAVAELIEQLHERYNGATEKEVMQ